MANTPEYQHTQADLDAGMASAQARLEQDVINGNTEELYKAVDRLPIAEPAKTVARNDIAAAVAKVKQQGLLTTNLAGTKPQGVTDKAKTAVASISDLKREAVAAKSVEKKNALAQATQLPDLKQSLVAAVNPSMDRIVPTQDQGMSPLEIGGTGQEMVPLELDNKAEDPITLEANRRNLEKFVNGNKQAKQAESELDAQAEVESPVALAEDLLKMELTKSVSSAKKMDVALDKSKIAIENKVEELTTKLPQSLSEAAARANANITMGVRSNLEAITDTAKDVLLKGGLSIGEGAYGLAETALYPVTAAGKLLTGGERVYLNEDDWFKTTVGGTTDISIGKGLENLGKSTIGVSLRPDFGKVKSDIQDTKSYASQVSKAVAETDARERQATVASVLKQQRSETGDVTWMDKTLEQTKSFGKALVDTWNNPIELGSVVAESAPSMLVPAAFTGAKINALTKGMSPADKTMFLNSAAGKAEIAKYAGKAGIGVSAAQEAASNSNQISEEIMNMPEEELLKTPQYTSLLEKGFSPEQARNALADAAGLQAFTVSFAVSAVASKTLNTGELEGMGFGLLTTTGGKKLIESAKEIGINTGKETAQEALESIGGQLSQNVAKGNTLNPEQDYFEGTGDAAVIGALAGGTTAAGFTTAAEAKNIVTASKEIAGNTVSTALLSAEQKQDKARSKLNTEIMDTFDKDKTEDFVKSENYSYSAKVDALLSTESLKRQEVIDDKYKTVANTALQVINDEFTAINTEKAAIQDKLDNGQLTSKEAKPLLKALDKRLEEAEVVKKQAAPKIGGLLNTFADKEELKTKLKAVVENENSKHSEATKQSFAELYRDLGSSASSFTDEEVTAIAQDNPEAAEFINTVRTADAIGKSTDQVADDILVGNKEFRSVFHHYENVKKGVETNNTGLLERSQNNLVKLLKSQTAKLAVYEAKVENEPNNAGVRNIYANVQQEVAVLQRLVKASTAIYNAHTGKPAAEIVPEVITDSIDLAPTTADVEVKTEAVEQPVKAKKERAVDNDVVKEEVTALAGAIYDLTGMDRTQNEKNKGKPSKLVDLAKFLAVKFKDKPVKELRNAIKDYYEGIKDTFENNTIEAGKSAYYNAGRKFAVKNGLITHSFKNLMEFRKKAGKPNLFKAKRKTKMTEIFKNPNLVQQIESELASGVEGYVFLKDYTDAEIEVIENSLHYVNKITKQIDDFLKISFTRKNSNVQEQGTTLVKDNPLLELTYQDESGNYVLDYAVKLSIAISALHMISENNTITKLLNNEDAINNILKRKKDTPVSAEEVESLQHVGQMLSLYAKAAGDVAMDLVGLDVVKNLSTPDMKNRIATAMGTVAVRALANIGFVELVDVPTSLLISLSQGDEYSSENAYEMDVKLADQEADSASSRTGEMTYADNGRVASFDKDRTKFVRPVKDKIEEFKALQSMISTQNQVLTKVFGIDPELLASWPSATTAKVSNKIKRSMAVLPAKLRTLLRAHVDQAHVLSNTSSLMMMLPDDIQEKVVGILPDEQLQDLHIIERTSLESKYEGLKREIQLYKEFISRGITAPFYFMHDVSTNRRMGIVNKINVQNSKIHRWLVSNADWKIKVENQTDREMYMYSVAAAFDASIDTTTNIDLIKEFNSIINNPIVRDAVKAIKRIEQGSTSESDYAALVAGVNEGGLNTHTLAALKSLTAYHPTESFEHDLALEIDGKTNGFAISLLQLFGASSEKQLKFLLVKTGIMNTYGNLSALKGLTDSYQTIALKWGESFEKFWITDQDTSKTSLTNIVNPLTDVMLANSSEFRKAMSSIMEPFTNSAGKVTSFARKLAKSPLMVWNYNSGMNSITLKFVDEVLEQDYKGLAKLKVEFYSEETANSRKVEIKKIFAEKSKAYSTLTGFTLTINEKNASTFYLKGQAKENFAATLGYAYGTALKSGIEDSFPALANNRKASNQTAEVAFNSYKVIYDKLAKMYMANNNVSYVSKEAHEVILKYLDEATLSIPAYESDTSIDKAGRYNDTSTWIGLGDYKQPKQSKTKKFNGKTYVENAKNPAKEESKVVVSYNKELPFVNKDGNTTYSKEITLTPQFDSYTEFDEAKAISVAPVQTHNIDAATMMQVFGEPVYNIHDAIVVGGKSVASIATKLNKAFFDVNYNYSIDESMNHMLDKLVMGFEKLARDKTPLNDVTQTIFGTQEALNEFKATLLSDAVVNLTYLKYDDEKQVNVREVLKQSVQRTANTNNKKRDAMDSIKYWNQYTFNNAAYLHDVKAKAVDMKATLNTAIDTALNDSNEFGSSADNFGTFQSLRDETIDNVASAQVLLNELHINDFAPTDAKHLAHLQTVLTTVAEAVKPVFVQLGSAIDGTLGKYEAASKTIKIKLRNTPVSLLRGMSAAETFTHEMLHHVVYPYLEHKNVYTNRLRWLYEVAKKHVKEEDLIERDAFGNKLANPTPDQIEAAKETWNYIFKNLNITQRTRINPITGMAETVVKHNGFHEFVVYATTNKQLMEVLRDNDDLNKEFKKGKKFEMKPSSASSSVIIRAGDYITHLINVVMNYVSTLSDRVFKIEGNTSDEVVMSILKNMTTTQQKNNLSVIQSYFNDTVLNEKAQDIIKNAVLSATTLKIATNLDKVTSKGIPLVSETSSIAASTIRATMQLTKAGKKGISDTVDRLRTLFQIGEDTLIGRTYLEIQGRNEKTDYIHVLRAVTNTFIDSMRNNARSNIKEYINKDLFKGQLSERENEAMYYVAAKADLQALEHYTVDEVKSILNDPRALSSKIKSVSKEITDMFPNNGMYYVKHALSLGNWMITGKGTQASYGKNAHVIANFHTAGQYKSKVKVEGDLQIAEDLIDELATLVALSKTSLTDRDMVHNLLVNNEEGVIAALEIHRKALSLAKEKNFDNNPMLMEKGYVSDVTNPKHSLVFAFASELPALLADNHELVYEKPIPKDRNDRNTQEMYVLVNKNGALNTLQGGVLSTTSNKARGTNLMQVRNMNNSNNLRDSLDVFFDGVDDIEAYNNVVEAEIAKQFTATDTAVDSNLLAPLFDELGNIVNYRYEMKHATKVTALQLHTRFDESISYTVSHIKDKINTKVINRIAIKSVFDDYLKYKTKEIHDYVFIGKDSTKQEHVELWYRMPYDARQEAETLFGVEGMFIRKRNVADFFGQREMRTKEVMEDLQKRLNYGVTRTLVKLAGSNKFRYYEDIAFEVFGMVRDTIVVKFGYTAIINLLSNALLVSMKTSKPISSIVNIAKGFSETNEYMALVKKLEQLKLQLASKRLTASEQRGVLSEMRYLEDEIGNNPLHFLIKQGVFQTVVEDLDPENESYSYAGQLEKALERYTSKIPDIVKDTFKLALMTHDTRLYKFMFKFTQLGDFAARYALYLDNKEKGMDDKANIKDIMETFVDYDYVTHPLIAYLNKINAFMFTKYLFRIQKTLIKTAIDKPLSVLMLGASQYGFGDMEDPFDALLSPDNLLNRVGDPASAIINTIGETMTIAPFK